MITAWSRISRRAIDLKELINEVITAVRFIACAVSLPSWTLSCLQYSSNVSFLLFRDEVFVNFQKSSVLRQLISREEASSFKKVLDLSSLFEALFL